jgi:hypothetical protein
MINIENSLYKFANLTVKILSVIFFIALVLMSGVFPIFENATIALPVKVGIISANGKSIAGLEVKQIAYDNDGTWKEKLMAQAGNGSWSAEKEVWLQAVKVYVPAMNLNQITGINVQIGGREFIYTDDQVGQNWQVGKNGGAATLLSPQALRAGSSRVSRFQQFINWPGDGQFIATAALRVLIAILGLFLLLCAVIGLNSQRYRFAYWWAGLKGFFTKYQQLVLPLVIILGVAARIGLSFTGYNFDMESYAIVGRILQHGGNVYIETARYNYGPIWFNIIGLLDKLVNYNFNGLKLAIPIFLTCIDLGIFAVLLKKFGKVPAAIFFLNPVSIIITGYGRQFNNVAVLAAMLGALIYGEDFIAGLSKRKFLGLVMLGISITVKHIFFVYPFWLAVKQRGLKEKFTALVLPVAIFFGSFLPYVKTAKHQILQNVFLYQSMGGTAVMRSLKLVFGEAYGLYLGFLLFLIALAVFGILFKKYSNLKSVLLYGLVLLLFTNSLVNQYLVIAAVGAAVFFNGFFALFFLVAGGFVASGMLGWFSWPDSLPGLALSSILLWLGFFQLMAANFQLNFKNTRWGKFLQTQADRLFIKTPNQNL